MNTITYNPSFIETIQSSTVCENGICYSYPIKHAIYNDESLSNCKGLGRFEELSVPFWYGHKKIPPKPKHYNINYFTDDDIVDVTDDDFGLNDDDDTMDDNRFKNIVDSIQIHDKKIKKSKKQIKPVKNKSKKKIKIH